MLYKLIQIPHFVHDFLIYLQPQIHVLYNKLMPPTLLIKLVWNLKNEHICKIVFRNIKYHLTSSARFLNLNIQKPH